MLRFRLISLLIFTTFVAVGVVVIREAGHGPSWIVWSAIMLYCAILMGTIYRPARNRNCNDELPNQAREGGEEK